MAAITYSIYMDVCCLNRPFDDWNQERIRLEAEAILLILACCQTGKWELASSKAIESEVEQTPDRGRVEQVMSSISVARTKVTVNHEIKQRVAGLIELEFKPYDALHIACAEMANVDVMLTTDDRLLRRASRYSDVLQIKLANPVSWLMTVTQLQGVEENESG